MEELGCVVDAHSDRHRHVVALGSQQRHAPQVVQPNLRNLCRPRPGQGHGQGQRRAAGNDFRGHDWVGPWGLPRRQACAQKRRQLQLGTRGLQVGCQGSSPLGRATCRQGAGRLASSPWPPRTRPLRRRSRPTHQTRVACPARRRAAPCSAGRRGTRSLQDLKPGQERVVPPCSLPPVCLSTARQLSRCHPCCPSQPPCHHPAAQQQPPAHLTASPRGSIRTRLAPWAATTSRSSCPDSPSTTRQGCDSNVYTLHQPPAGMAAKNSWSPA